MGRFSSSSSSTTSNESALNEYKRELNIQAQIRDYLIPYTANLTSTTSSSIILQATSLAELTQATNQLTQTMAVRKTNQFDIHTCHFS